MRQRFFKYFFAVVFTLVFGEMYCRWAVRDIRYGPSFTIADPEHGWVIRKNFVGRRATREYTMLWTTGEQGFRGRTYDKIKPDGVLRIASLGNSQAFGVGVNDDETYAHLMEKELSRIAHRPVEVINMAVTDTGTDVILSMWDEILGFSPDILVVRYDYWNFQDPYRLYDYQAGRLVKREQERMSSFRQFMDRQPLTRHLEKSALYGFARLIIPRYSIRLHEATARLFNLNTKHVLQTASAAGNRFATTMPLGGPTATPADDQECRLLTELVRRARAAGIPLVIAWFNLDLTGPQTAMELAREQRFKDITSVAGVYTLDLRDMLPIREYFYPVDEHLSPAGHAHVASQLSSIISEKLPNVIMGNKPDVTENKP